jgi:hypothetical protein
VEADIVGRPSLVALPAAMMVLSRAWSMLAGLSASTAFFGLRWEPFERRAFGPDCETAHYLPVLADPIDGNTALPLRS